MKYQAQDTQGNWHEVTAMQAATMRLDGAKTRTYEVIGVNNAFNDLFYGEAKDTNGGNVWLNIYASSVGAAGSLARALGFKLISIR